MPARLESDLEKRVVREAATVGWWPLKLVALGHRGFPDRWFVRRGLSGAPEIIIIEFKAPGKRARKLQVYVCNKLSLMGFEVHAEVSRYEEAVDILGL